MKIFVRVKPGSKKESVEKTDETHFTVRVKEPPRDGRANRATIKALGEFLDIPPSRLMVVSGATAREKIIQID
jgi:uncharacterized protein